MLGASVIMSADLRCPLSLRRDTVVQQALTTKPCRPSVSSPLLHEASRGHPSHFSAVVTPRSRTKSNCRSFCLTRCVSTRVWLPMVLTKYLVGNSTICLQTLFASTDVVQVNIAAATGDMGILANHVPSIEPLRPGVVEVIESGSNSQKWFGTPSSPFSHIDGSDYDLDISQ